MTTMSTHTDARFFDDSERPSAVAVLGDQLDLFAESETAELQHRLDHAPTLFDTAQRGYFLRVAAADQWAQDYGNWDCFRRSHAWHAQIGAKGLSGEHPTDACRPTILTASLSCDHSGHDCLCVGDTVYRGACLHCTWEGPVRDSQNPAVEDAHDHAWSGWRDLPLVPPRPAAATCTQEKAALTRWLARINALYPRGWLESGGPIRTSRRAHGTRHVPNRTGFGGYDLCGRNEQPTPNEPTIAPTLTNRPSAIHTDPSPYETKAV